MDKAFTIQLAGESAVLQSLEVPHTAALLTLYGVASRQEIRII